MTYIIGFTKKFYTQWEVVNNNNKEHRYIKNISTDINKVRLLYPNIVIDTTIKGKKHRNKKGNNQKKVALKRAWQIFKSGKYESFSICLKKAWTAENNVPDFNTLYNKYYNKTLSWLLYTTKNKEQAEELCQDTYVKVFNNLDTFNPEKSNIYTWIINICKNLLIDHSRSKQYKNSQKTYNDIDDKFSDSSTAILVIPTYDDASDMLDAKQLQKDIDKVYSNMRPIYAHVHKLFMEGHKYREIADMLNMDKSLVGVYVMRARNILKEKLHTYV